MNEPPNVPPPLTLASEPVFPISVHVAVNGWPAGATPSYVYDAVPDLPLTVPVKIQAPWNVALPSAST